MPPTSRIAVGDTVFNTCLWMTGVSPHKNATNNAHVTNIHCLNILYKIYRSKRFFKDHLTFQAPENVILNMNINTLNEYKQRKLIKCQTHPTRDLLIWNYTEIVQAHGPWDDTTTRTRGLVTDSHGVIMAHSFKKFHNIEQKLYTPTQTYTVYDKMDGSLGILFWHEDQWIMCSRGSFTSDQAHKATNMLYEKAYDLNKLRKDLAYNFEIIYPQNRIVVDYGPLEDLIFLAAFAKDGAEVECDDTLQGAGFTIVKKWRADAVEGYLALKARNLDNSEGFVVRFSNGDRVKIKFEEYMRLHRVVTNINALSVWEMLKSGKPLDDHLENIPDEFFVWVQHKWETYQQQYTAIENETKHAYDSIMSFIGEHSSRKDFAVAVRASSSNAKLLFALYDQRSIRDMIVDMIRPTDGVYDTPFPGKPQDVPPSTKRNMNRNVIILVGPSGSGKSTWACEYIQENPSHVRINRDTLRQQLFGYTTSTMQQYYKNARQHEREKIVTTAELALLQEFLKLGKDVIIDNTNLKSTYIDTYLKAIKRSCNGHTVNVSFKVFDTPYEACVQRNLCRDLGEASDVSVIQKQFDSLVELKTNYDLTDKLLSHNKTKLQLTLDHELPKGYIFDIDGTLADNTHRDPYDLSMLPYDTPITPVVETLRAHHQQGFKIIICSGRDVVCQIATERWLLSHNIPFDELHMRPRGDKRADYKVKEELWKDIIKRTRVIAMYDDRDCVVEHGRAMGFQVFQVNYGNF